MANSISRAQNQRALVFLTAIIAAAGILAALYWAKAVLIPFALAIFLTFMLLPVVNVLERNGLRRLTAVIITTLIAGVAIAGIGWLVASEFASVLGELPSYTGTAQKKIEALRSSGEDGLFQRLDKWGQDLLTAWQGGAAAASGKPTPTPVVMESNEPGFLVWLPSYLPPAVEFVSQTGLVIVLAIFMLIYREDLRNRCIRLIGRGNITTTTKAVDEAGQRISRFLFMQLVVNGCYGLAFGVGLALMGIEHAVLWGFLAGLLRYVPYLGAPVAGFFPLALSLIQFETWWPPLYVVGLYAVLEVLAYNVVEPLVYGRSTGVSPVALLAAAAFWAFLWGPIGLVLSCPLTVCLVVMGKYVPHLEFLAVLLSDESPLEETTAFYQRLSAHDTEEAARIVKVYTQQHPPEELFDGLLLPALSTARRDSHKGLLNVDDEHFIQEANRGLIADWQAAHANPPAVQGNGSAGSMRINLVAVPARDETDVLAMEMMRLLLDPNKWHVEICSAGALPADVEKAVDDHQAALIVIGAVQPGSRRRARYLCKLLRKKRPDLWIGAALWNKNASPNANGNALMDAGADLTASSLLELRDHLRAWRPVLKER
ncbi:MAG TPA: AI-2E family transporter, partial [Gemmataceae bacterium]|nr:AI-2E family transporter [Gemmataceae bacterium]